MKILLFARLREAYGAQHLEIEDGSCPADVASLRRLIVSQAVGEFAEAMADANVICAVNQHVAADDMPVGPADEIAFFPPMTGG